MKNLKIGVIGAGSAIWSSNFIIDLSLNPGFKGSIVTLMDIDRDRLETVTKFARRYSSERKSEINFEMTLERRKAIEDSDVVINLAMAGGHSYYERMRRISEKYGYYRGINSVEWNMVSDYHTIWGFKQFKLAMEIANDLERYSQDSWLIQISNPVLELTTLLGRKTKLRIIGLCHGHLDAGMIASAMGLNEKDMLMESIGLNHTIWLTKFMRDGRDEYPTLREWIEQEYKNFYKDWLQMSESSPFLSQMSPAMVDMFRTYGLVPVGDTVRSGTWKYHRDLKTKKRWYGGMGGFDSGRGWNYYLHLEREAVRELKMAVKDETVTLSSLYPPEMSREPVIPLIDSILNDKGMVHQVNVINEGAVDGIPDNVAAEFPAFVDGKGVHRKGPKNIPSRILHFSIYPRIMRMEWAIDAFLEGGRQTLEQWLIDDPRTRNERQVNSVIEAILSMPENQDMARHFR
ncbi:MAG: alpha-glucosidase/alpha-galactosidase [Thermoplasmata archaeon]